MDWIGPKGNVRFRQFSGEAGEKNSHACGGEEKPLAALAGSTKCVVYGRTRGTKSKIERMLADEVVSRQVYWNYSI
jgi:hypothetical protein